MTTLESMAKARFQEYVERERGPQAVKELTWENLERARKIDWISEVYHMAEFIAEHWQSKIGNNPGKIEGIPTSYMMGVHKGIEKERIRNIGILVEIRSTLMDEYMGILEGEYELSNGRRMS